MHRVIARSPRWALTLWVSVLVCAATIAVPAIRTPILRTAGWALVVDDPIEPAEIIVVTSDASDAGVLEAADLVQRGIATRVAVFTDPPDAVVDREFIRRGIPYDDAAARSVRQLRSLGVANIEQVPRAAAGTEGEGRVLPDWFDRHSFRSVVVVSSAEHSRRVRRVLRRAMEGHPTKVTVRFTRYSQFDPDRWWQTRAGIRTGLIEFQKLLLDIARHPTS